jgi:hypothetical protein
MRMLGGAFRNYIALRIRNQQNATQPVNRRMVTVRFDRHARVEALVFCVVPFWPP